MCRRTACFLVVSMATWLIGVDAQQAASQVAPAPTAPGPGAGRGRGEAGPQLVSPQVNPDRTITLRLLAPKASEVRITGEILNGAQPTPMTRNAEGIWSAVLGPLPPDVYTYGFNIDGVNATDPRNPWVKLVSGAGLASQVQVPGDGLQYYDSKPVPHGLIQILTYESKATGATRQAWVYTPPEYHRTTNRYPVFYLLHGGGDMEPGWVTTGRAHIIMDNLIAEKKARPMIVVMPLARGGGSMGLGPSGMSPGIAASGNLAPAGRGAMPGPGAASAQSGPAPLGAFAQDFVGDLMPVVERTFRASTRPEDRAIGGLSMGGAATVNTAFSRPELFRYVIVMSAGGGQNLEEAYPKFFGNGAVAARQMRLIWVGVGDQDFALNGSKTLHDALTKNSIKHTFVINEGFRHEWRLWRLHLRDVVPLLFQTEGTALSTPSAPQR